MEGPYLNEPDRFWCLVSICKENLKGNEDKGRNLTAPPSVSILNNDPRYSNKHVSCFYVLGTVPSASHAGFY